MRKSEYESRKAKLIEQLKNLEAENVENDIWQPKEDEEYFYITSEFTVDETTNELTELDRKMIRNGNCFKTKEEALYYADFISYNLRYRRFVNENKNKCTSARLLLPKVIMPDAMYYIGKENFDKYI